jgi:hypothetical protein
MLQVAAVDNRIIDEFHRASLKADANLVFKKFSDFYKIQWKYLTLPRKYTGGT